MERRNRRVLLKFGLSQRSFLPDKKNDGDLLRPDSSYEGSNTLPMIGLNKHKYSSYPKWSRTNEEGTEQKPVIFTHRFRRTSRFLGRLKAAVKPRVTQPVCGFESHGETDSLCPTGGNPVLLLPANMRATPGSAAGAAATSSRASRNIWLEAPACCVGRCSSANGRFCRMSDISSTPWQLNV